MKLSEAVLAAIAIGGVAYAVAKSSESGGGGGGAGGPIRIETPVNVEGVIRSLSESFEKGFGVLGASISELSKGQTNLAEFFGKQIGELARGQVNLTELFLRNQAELAKALEKIGIESQKNWSKVLEELVKLKTQASEKVPGIPGTGDWSKFNFEVRKLMDKLAGAGVGIDIFGHRVAGLSFETRKPKPTGNGGTGPAEWIAGGYKWVIEQMASWLKSQGPWYKVRLPGHPKGPGIERVHWHGGGGAGGGGRRIVEEAARKIQQMMPAYRRAISGGVVVGGL